MSSLHFLRSILRGRLRLIGYLLTVKSVASKRHDAKVAFFVNNFFPPELVFSLFGRLTGKGVVAY